MKLKQIPSDFIVEEIPIIVPKPKGNYVLYHLHKTGLETLHLLSYLGKMNDIPVGEFGIAGVKDKHAITSQFFTLAKKYKIRTLQEENFQIEERGFVDSPIKLGDLVGNRFKIVVRGIAKGELPGLAKKAESIRRFGVPNYFDSQRFGSVVSGNFVIKHVIQQDCEGAMRLFLTGYSKFDSSEVKKEKKSIRDNWQDLSSIKPKSQMNRQILEEYNKTKDWLMAYRKIPSALREFLVTSYQSYLWNESLKLVLRACLNRRYLYTIDYDMGSLVFYKELVEKKPIPTLLKTVSDQLSATGLEKSIIDHVLSREGLSIRDFQIKDRTGNFFKTHDRSLLVIPTALELSPPTADELNRNRFKLSLTFVLPKGSYATIVTKRLFNH